MKTIKITRDISVRVGPRAEVAYQAGKTYPRVPEAQASEILARGAGEEISEAGSRRARGDKAGADE